MRYVVTGAAGFVGSHLAERLLAVERHAAAVGDVRRTSADGEKSRRELGWAPTTALADGLAAQWAWVAGRVAAR